MTEKILCRVTTTEFATIEVQETRVVYDDDGVEIARGLPHNCSYAPGESLPDDVHETVRAHAELAWTPDVVTAYQAKRDAAINALFADAAPVDAAPTERA